MANQDICDLELADLSPEEKNAVREVSVRLYAKNKYAPEGVREAIGPEIAAFEKALEAEKIIEERTRLLNKAAKYRLVDYVLANFKDNPEEGIMTYLLGSQYNRPGARDHVANLMQVYSNKYKNLLRQQLLKSNVFKLAKDGSLDEEVALVIDAIDNKKSLRGFSEEAVSYAKIVNNLLDVMRTDANKAGAAIGDLPGYIFKRAHRASAVKADREGWTNFMKAKVDWERMGFPKGEIFDALPDIEKAQIGKKIDDLLSDEWMEFSSGVHLQGDLIKGSSGLTGFASIAKRMSKERIFHFKNPVDEIEYARKYGYQTIFQNLVSNSEQRGRQIAVLSRLGPNAEMNVDDAVNEILDAYKKTGLSESSDRMSELKKFANSKLKRSVLPHITGSYMIDSDNLWDNITSVTLGVQRWSLLGRSGLVSFMLDPLVAAFSSWRRSGELTAVLDSYFRTFHSMFKNLSSADVQDELADIATHNDFMLVYANPKFDPYLPAGTRVQEVVSAVDNTFFYLNGQYAVDTRNRARITTEMTRFFGKIKKKSYDQLHDYTRSVLKKHNIDNLEWELVRTIDSKVNGRDVFRVGPIYDLPDEMVGNVLNSRGLTPTAYMVEKFKTDLADKFRGLFNDELNYSVIMADDRIKADTDWGMRGTPGSFIIRSMLQFKNYPLAYVQRIIGRELYDDDLPRAVQFRNIAGALLLTTIGGYIALNIDDLMKGREPRKFDSRIIAESMLRGGGLGIYGDVLYALESGAFSDSVVMRLMGPTFQNISRLAEISSGVLHGDSAQSLDATAKLFMKNIPGSNIFYTKPILDYVIMNQLNEAISPGMLSRNEQRTRKEKGQDYFMMKPSETMLFK